MKKTFIVLCVLCVCFGGWVLLQAAPQTNTYGSAVPILNGTYDATNGAIQTVAVDRGITTPQTNTYGSLVPIFNAAYDTTLGALQVSLYVPSPAAQTITGGDTIAADACDGGLKQITAAGAVTTDTTDTFTAPAAANTGCCMDVVNIGAENITLDNNAHFFSAAAGNVVMTANDGVRVCSNGSAWYQITPLQAN